VADTSSPAAYITSLASRAPMLCRRLIASLMDSSAGGCSSLPRTSCSNTKGQQAKLCHWEFMNYEGRVMRSRRHEPVTCSCIVRVTVLRSINWGLQDDWNREPLLTPRTRKREME